MRGLAYGDGPWRRDDVEEAHKYRWVNAVESAGERCRDSGLSCTCRLSLGEWGDQLPPPARRRGRWQLLDSS